MTLEKCLRPGLFSLGMGLEKIVDGFQQNSDPPQIQSPVCDGAPVRFLELLEMERKVSAADPGAEHRPASNSGSELSSRN